jgi:CHRD domain
MNSHFVRVAVAALLVGGFAAANATDVAVILTGDQEVPAVATAAKGTGKLVVGDDKAVSGTIMTSGINATMAHIHEGGPGKNGPPIITLQKSGEDSWSVPAGSKLTDEQYKSFQAGKLYVNVHSDAHKSGEIRAQLKP